MRIKYKSYFTQLHIRLKMQTVDCTIFFYLYECKNLVSKWLLQFKFCVTQSILKIHLKCISVGKVSPQVAIWCPGCCLLYILAAVYNYNHQHYKMASGPDKALCVLACHYIKPVLTEQWSFSISSNRQDPLMASQWTLLPFHNTSLSLFFRQVLFLNCI
jgi:hypothetical protein